MAGIREVSNPARPSITSVRARFSSSSRGSPSKAGSEHRADGVVRREQRILRDIGQPGLFAQRPDPSIRRLLPGQNFEQGGLAAAIRPDQAGRGLRRKG